MILGQWLGLGVIGIALAMAGDWAVKAALTLWRYRSEKWKNLQVI